MILYIFELLLQNDHMQIETEISSSLYESVKPASVRH